MASTPKNPDTADFAARVEIQRKHSRAGVMQAPCDLWIVRCRRYDKPVTNLIPIRVGTELCRRGRERGEGDADESHKRHFHNGPEVAPPDMPGVDLKIIGRALLFFAT